MNKFEIFVTFIVAIIVITAGEIMLRDGNRYVKYDCRLVDVSPDMPEDVKRICRSRR